MKNLSRRQFLINTSAALALGGFASAFLAACDKKRNFKVGVCDWTLGLAGNPKSLAVGKEIGLDGVQVSSNGKIGEKFFTPEQIEQYKAMMKQTGLAIASTSPTCMNGQPFYSEEGAEEFTCQSIDTANALGAKTILLPFYGKANMQDASKKMDEKHFEPLVRHLKNIAPHAEKMGVTICLEDSISAEENIRVIDAVGSNFVKVYFDIFNSQYYGHNTLHELNTLGKKYIGEIHLKDKGHKLDSGSGMPVNMEACFDAIYNIGYDGWLVMELHGHNPAKDGTVIDVLKHNLDYIKRSRLNA